MRHSLALVVASLCCTAPAAAQPQPIAPPPAAAAEAGLRTLRYHREDEDWRWLARGARTPDAWDPLKLVPLPGGATVSFGADLRAYYEDYRDEAFGTRLPRNRYFQNRALVHGDLRLGGGLRVFTQLQSEGVTTRKGGPRRSIDRNDLDLNQAFVEAAVPGGALRLGRQELRLGVGRIVSTRDGVANVRQPLDGARLILRRGPVRLDAFAFRQVLTTPDAFDDRSAGQPYLWGANLARPPARPGAEGWELYALGYDARQSPYFEGTGEERRRTLGVRLYGARGGFDHDVEANVQFGRFGPGRIRAWSASGVGGYTFREARLRPRLGAGFSVASGDARRGDGALGSYRPFVVQHPWGQLVPFGVTNVAGVQAVASVQPRPSLRLTARRYWMRRMQGEEGLYTAGYTPFRPGSARQSREIGTQSEALAEYDHSRHLRVTLLASHVDAGRYIVEGGGKDIGYLAAIFLYRF